MSASDRSPSARFMSHLLSLAQPPLKAAVARSQRWKWKYSCRYSDVKYAVMSAYRGLILKFKSSKYGVKGVKDSS
jgi:hypothetical protein